VLGRELIAQCAEGDRIELASGAGKVHWVWLDRSGPRICRPSMLDSTKPGGTSEWRRFQGSEAEFQRRMCREWYLQNQVR
jgi:hypothetical protein